MKPKKEEQQQQQQQQPSLPDPPGRWIQKINAILHDNDSSSTSRSRRRMVMGDGPILSYVFYMCYWCTIFGILAPIVVFIYLPTQCVVQIIHYLLSTHNIVLYHQKRQKCNTNGTNENSTATSKCLDFGIVITGCDTGFGKELALYAANELGYTVFAGCLHPHTSWDTDHSTATATTTTTTTTQHGTIVPIAMDVTDSIQVSNVVRHVQQWLFYQDTNNDHNKNDITPTPTPTSSLQQQQHQPRRVLHALINNAGVGRGSIVDWSNKNDDLSDYQYCMNGTFFVSFIIFRIVVLAL